MKTKLLLIAGICLFCGAFSMKAQDTVIVKEGDLTYIKTKGLIEKYETKDLMGHYYRGEANLDRSKQSGEKMRSIYRSVFSKKRAKQLSNVVLVCNVYMDVVENKVVKVNFHTNKKDFPIKLSELDELEKKIRIAYPELFRFIPYGDNTIGYAVGGGQLIGFHLKFKTLYDED
jgi:hypothetical protein